MLLFLRNMGWDGIVGTFDEDLSKMQKVNASSVVSMVLIHLQFWRIPIVPPLSQ